MSEQPGAAGRPCQRPQCEGAYEDMGGGELYCDTCGLAPVVAPGGLLGSVPTGLTGHGPGNAAASLRAGSTAGSSSASAGAGSAASSGGGSSTPSGAGSSASTGSTSQHASAGSRSSRRSVSGRLSRSLSGRSTSRSVSVRSARSGTSGSSARARLGAGLVRVPPVPRPDPATVVLANPEVPERKRFCGNSGCGAPVGRSRGGRPGRTEGFCTACGHPYSFVPKLHPGDVVHGQYEVAGCLAHGGLGWVYLAVDRAVSDRWVVLKGLLDTGDEDAMAAAIAERRFLAEIEHANIVRIYNFVEHLDPRTGSLDGYIVMEYVGGSSLKEIANARRTPDGRRDPLPVEQACAYGIEALEALGHLHSRNLVYCDFKVDNAIQQDDQLKLIDMGAVRRMDDDESAIYGTVGYQAPEVAEEGPSVASDLYTVARTLAVLTFDFQGYTTVYADSLPDPAHIEVFRRYESFHRLLVRATDPDPQRRFASAEEMSEQLLGVLREVVALQTGEPHPALSTLFGPELRVVDTELVGAAPAEVSLLGARTVRRGRRRRAPALAAAPASVALPAQAPAGTARGTAGSTEAGVPAASPLVLRPLPAAAAASALPVPRVDPADPNAGFLAGLMTSAPGELLAALDAAPADSPEVRLRGLRAHLELSGGPAGPGPALDALAALEARHPDDWRVVWYRGLVSLVTGDHESAAVAFDAVYDAFPGEPAPKLALGFCAELLGRPDDAADYYRLVWATDPAHVNAAFGLARVQLAAGDRTGAVRTLESVPASSIHFTAARVAAVRARLRQRPAHEVALDELRAAARQVEQLAHLGLDVVRRHELTCEVLGCALDRLLCQAVPAPGAAPGVAPAGAPGPPAGERLLDSPFTEEGLRFGLERSYRLLARHAQTGTERIELVERANRFRPRTWV
ncbi:tetratricopeptide repeat protein [Streptomyces sp. GSL17-113]|uniref:serine/threonine-protein kinase n=1 Tax=Streptomyces sp. GSL17-113 TaxID=3115365 RepID=UPI003FA6D6C7